MVSLPLLESLLPLIETNEQDLSDRDSAGSRHSLNGDEFT